MHLFPKSPITLALFALLQTAAAQQQFQITSFSVGPDETLTYPNGSSTPHLVDLPDEHTTFMPPATAGGPYLVFGASKISGTNTTGGAVVLQTTDFTNFTFASPLGYTPQVMTPPTAINQCNPTYTTEFDGNYAAPGSVVQDPTLPAGNFIMIYEAENHCPSGVVNMNYYATTGFARSSDAGKTWPAPINSVLGGPARHPVLQSSDPQPSAAHGPEGDAIPSAFVDLGADHNYYLYVTYGYHPAGGNGDGLLRVARAQLGASSPTFLKWYNGSFSQPGIGGSDTGVMPSHGCGNGAQEHGEISYNDDLGLYVMIFACISGQTSPRAGAWYYSTATSLDLQNWTAPQPIQNSQFPVTLPCPGLTSGSQFDGWYPSTVSPGAAAGHTKLTGYFFFQNGCDTGTRTFVSRAFTITAVPILPEISKVANAEGENAIIAPNTWVEIKGANLSPGGDVRIWQGSDFVNNQMPVALDGVSATVNGKSAFVYYISPSQINILTPPDALSGAVDIQVTNNGATSAAFTVQTQSLSPSFFVFDATHVAATHAGGAYLGPASLGAGFTPAQPGETVVLYANGFGATSAPIVNGAMSQGGTLSTLPVIKIGGVQASVQFAGLVSPGEFQFNVVVPSNIPGGDEPIVAIYNGLTTQAGTVLAVQGSPAPGSITFYVAPNGNDSWSGKLASPNASKADGPFATFDRARSVVQPLAQSAPVPILVQFRGGTYYLPATVEFTAADSGGPTNPIVYMNYPNETPVFSGGTRLQNWTNVSGNTWKTTLPASTQYFEQMYYNGARRLRPRLGGGLGTYYRIAATVFLNTPAPPAAAPNANCSIYVTGSGWECFDRFQYNPADPIVSNWRNLAPAAGNLCGQPAGNAALAGDVELLDFEQYTASSLRISCVDTNNHIVYLTGPTTINAQNYTAMGFLPQHRYLIENVQDDLTQPGQWFLDRSVTPWTVTYLANPGENPNNDTVVIPQLPQLLVASGLQYVTFQGLTFEHDNYTVPAIGHPDVELPNNISGAVSFQNTQYITFDSSTVAHTTGAGIEFLSCINVNSPAWCVARSPAAITAYNTIQNSAFYDLGYAGIHIGTPGRAGNTTADIPQFNLIQNNVVEGYGRQFPNAWGIVQGEGHDNTYTHNDVYDGYHTAIGVCGCSTEPPLSSDNIISFNHVYNLFQGIMNDAGSLYFGIGYGTTPPGGNKIYNNKVHDVSDASALDADGYGGNGIYIDAESGLVDVENNLVYRVSGNGINFPRAPPGPNQASTVRNNIVAYTRLSLINDGLPYIVNGVEPNPVQVFTATNNLFYFDRTSSSTPAFNVQGGCTYSAGFAYTAFQYWNSNMYWRTDGAFATDPKAFHVQPSPFGVNLCTEAVAKWTYLTFAGWQNTGEDTQSVVQNPGFPNPAYPTDDYSLPKGSPGAGFFVFDPSQAGRTNPVTAPPPVPSTFPTRTFNPATDY